VLQPCSIMAMACCAPTSCNGRSTPLHGLAHLTSKMNAQADTAAALRVEGVGLLQQSASLLLVVRHQIFAAGKV